MNFTPGPWKLETAPGGVNDGWQISSENTSRGKGRYVILASRGPIAGEEFAGNAKLMAAAPEMYEMLNKLRMEMDNLSFNLHSERDIEYAEDTRDSIHALFRRIEGDTDHE